MKEKIIEILKAAYRWGRDNGEGRSNKNFNDFLDTSGVRNIEQFVNQEVERRIKERMPSEEEIEKAFTTEHYHWEQGRHYRVRKDRIFGAKWLRSRLINPGVNDSQKTEGGGE